MSTIKLRLVKCATFEAATGAPANFSADKRHKNWQHACYHNRPNSIQCVADGESSKAKTDSLRAGFVGQVAVGYGTLHMSDNSTCENSEFTGLLQGGIAAKRPV